MNLRSGGAMDSPSDLFCQQSSPMCPFGLYRSPSGSAPSAPRYPGGSPPTYPLMSPLLHPSSASQSWGGYRQRPGLFQAPSLEQELEDDGMDEPEHEDELLVRGPAAAAMAGGPTLLSHLFPGGARRGVASEPEEWSQDVLQVKRLRMESSGVGKRDGEAREGEDERRGRARNAPQQRPDEDEGRSGGPMPRKGSREGRKRQRQELKLQLQETREKLLELQKRVWKAYDKQQTQEDQRRDKGKGEGEKGRMEAEEMEEMFFEEGEGDDHLFNSEDLLPQGHLSSKKNAQQNVNGTGDLSPDETMDLDVDLEQGLDRGSVWVGCGLIHGEWEGPSGGQKFAQALKQELGSAVARVIDRVIRLYADGENSAPAGLAALVVHDQRNGGLGSGLRNADDDQRRPSGVTAAQALEQAEASSLVPISRHQEKRTNGYSGLPPSGHRGPPQSSPNLPHLSQAPALPALLPPPPRSKDHFLSSFPSAPPAVPLPLLHYTMQHLFARSLSNLPLHKDSLPPEPFLDFRSHGPSFPPLPLGLGQLEPPLSSSGRGRDGGIRGGGGGMGGMDGGDLYLGAASSQEGLSPCHLKKAKLMFFYARYPSSNTLKTYFPDVKVFNRCVTSQLIKWFSNFREFFYIQMERFARQAVRDGVVAPREGGLRLGRNSELFRILNMHYNKSNDYQVPERFVEVSELALREFFSAIQGGRDTDPCWKKSIYKIICKLDSPIPDSFRLPGCPVDTHRSV
ncbi:prospero homeobox 3 isoform X1 [Alosa sapidissima]|uniref:prospero homeobox 3 isoform X1 n=1 Tax=Alosa sapidissima TaxID=34773 RepID=UPI001C084922|nr:prospero homeobox 3 isoform X1 [Alosa sapidissima]